MDGSRLIGQDMCIGDGFAGSPPTGGIDAVGDRSIGLSDDMAVFIK